MQLGVARGVLFAAMQVSQGQSPRCVFSVMSLAGLEGCAPAWRPACDAKRGREPTSANRLFIEVKRLQPSLDNMREELLNFGKSPVMFPNISQLVANGKPYLTLIDEERGEPLRAWSWQCATCFNPTCLPTCNFRKSYLQIGSSQTDRNTCLEAPAIPALPASARMLWPNGSFLGRPCRDNAAPDAMPLRRIWQASYRHQREREREIARNLQSRLSWFCQQLGNRQAHVPQPFGFCLGAQFPHGLITSNHAGNMFAGTFNLAHLCQWVSLCADASHACSCAAGPTRCQ